MESWETTKTFYLVVCTFLRMEKFNGSMQNVYNIENRVRERKIHIHEWYHAHTAVWLVYSDKMWFEINLI